MSGLFGSVKNSWSLIDFFFWKRMSIRRWHLWQFVVNTKRMSIRRWHLSLSRNFILLFINLHGVLRCLQNEGTLFIILVEVKKEIIIHGIIWVGLILCLCGVLVIKTASKWVHPQMAKMSEPNYLDTRIHLC